VAKPEEYEWSSYRQLIEKAETPSWLTTSFILGFFSGKNPGDKYREFVNDAINRDDESPLKKVIGSTILGNPDFVREMSQQHLGDKQTDRNIPAVRVLNRPGIDEIIKAVARDVKEEALAKKVSIYFCHRYSGARLREIGERFGMSDAAIAQASRRMKVAYESNEKLRKLLDVVETKLKMSSVET
jgi:hypothetical protein